MSEQFLKVAIFNEIPNLLLWDHSDNALETVKNFQKA